VTVSGRRLEAPHRRLEPRSPFVERFVVAAFRTASWILGRVPERPAAALVGLGAQLSYLVWPAKRRWSNANFAHVLGLPPHDRRVHRLALRAYRRYGRYLVDVMRLPRMDREHAAAQIPAHLLDGIEPIWRQSEGGLIFTLGHVGNNEAAAAGIAGRGWPVNVVADDSSYPGLFEDFRRLRESWGVHVIPWRNLREIYRVLKQREMLALLVDWGYRPDGIPVRLFDAWTTLPAGPATLAAKTGSRILPISIRQGAKTFELRLGEPITVRSTDPADLARATQAMADALADGIAWAPEQWYSFKPIWPETEAERAELEARAQAVLAAASSTSGAPAALARGDDDARDRHPPTRDLLEAIEAPIEDTEVGAR
jgi:lauroyl/myristoyl acyltransferase